jgi:hypothetical protein
MPFELRSPSGLWLLVLLGPLILFYVLKIRREQLRVPSTWLWASAERDLLARQPFRKLIVQLPLILQLLALALLALALSHPAAKSSVIGGSHLAIVIDTSASMNARGGDGKTRMDEARTAAKRILRSLAPGSEVLIVEAGREPRLASALDRDTRRLEAAVDRLKARDVEGNLGRALALANDRLRQVPAPSDAIKRIMVITDGALADRPVLEGAVLPTDVIRVGSPADNSAIVRIDVRSGIDPASKREQVQVFSLVAHYGSKPRDVFLTLRQRNVSEPLASRRLSLAPGERAPVVLTFAPAPADAGSGLIVELSPPDALTTDDQAFGRVPAGRHLPVVLAPKDGNAWVKRAFLADPDVELLGAPLDALDSATVPDDALLVVDGACPNKPLGADVLILNPPAGPCLTTTIGKPLENLGVTSWTESDPRLRFLMLDGVSVTKARVVETESPAQALVRAGKAVLVSDISTPERTGTLVAFDVEDSNWPLKASFVLFLRNVAELARAHRSQAASEPTRTGESVRVRIPSDVSQVSVQAPDGSLEDVNARASLAILPDTTRAGFYHVSWQGARAGSVLFLANLVSEAESDIRPRELTFGVHGLPTKNASDALKSFTDLAWLIAGCALAFMIFDIAWFTRRKRIRQSFTRARPLAPERAGVLRRFAEREFGKRSAG